MVFTNMVVSWAYQQQIENTSKKFLLVTLANHANSRGIVNELSLGELSELLGLSKTTTRKALVELEEAHLVNRIAVMRVDSRRRLANNYELLLSDTFGIDLKPEEEMVPLITRSIKPKPSRGLSSKVSTRHPGSEALIIWEHYKRESWTNHRVLSPRALNQVGGLIKAYGSIDAGLQALREALQWAVTLDWTDTDLSFENLGSNGKFIEYAEKWASQQKAPIAGNTLGSLMSSAKRDNGTRDPTEEEWNLMNDDDKLLFIHEGQLRDHRNAKYTGRVRIISKQGTLLKVCPLNGSGEFFSHPRYLGRTTHKEGSVRAPIRERSQNSNAYQG